MENQEIDALRQELQDHMAAENLSGAAIGKAIGYSSGVVSGWLRGSYDGNIDRLCQAVASYLERFRERKLRVFDMPFIETSVSKKVFEIARICHLDNELGVCVSHAGLGKTMAVKEYAKLNTDTILVEADSGYTPIVLFNEIADKLGVENSKNLHILMDSLIQKLAGSGRLIIVDEAEHLPYKALELLRRIYDKAQVGILLVGMPKLIKNMRGNAGEYKQLYSRVGVYGQLDPLKPIDVQNTVAAAISNAAENLWQPFLKECRSNMRVLVKLLRRSQRIASVNGTEINEEIVREAGKTLIV